MKAWNCQPRLKVSVVRGSPEIRDRRDASTFASYGGTGCPTSSARIGVYERFKSLRRLCLFVALNPCSPAVLAPVAAGQRQSAVQSFAALASWWLGGEIRSRVWRASRLNSTPHPALSPFEAEREKFCAISWQMNSVSARGALTPRTALANLRR